jgi:hypothetical protein
MSRVTPAAVKLIDMPVKNELNEVAATKVLMTLVPYSIRVEPHGTQEGDSVSSARLGFSQDGPIAVDH